MATLTLELDGVEHRLADTQEHFLKMSGGRVIVSQQEDSPRDIGYFVWMIKFWRFEVHLDRLPAALLLDGAPVTTRSVEVGKGRVSLRTRADPHGPTVPLDGRRPGNDPTRPATGPAAPTRPATGPAAPTRPANPVPPQRPGVGRPAGAGREWVIGRLGTGADLAIDDPQVQADHARISVDGDGRWWVTPANGPVYQDGKRWFTAVLEPGQTFVVGQTSIVVDHSLLAGSRPAAAGPVRAETAPPIRVSAGRGLAVRLSHVTVRRGGRVLLDDVNLEIPGGEVVAVLGPSGAGKSSLIKVLLGEYAPDRGGSVTLGADSSAQYSDSMSRREQVRYVPQSDDLYDQLSVMETLRFAARFRAAPDSTKAEIEKLVTDAMSALRLTGKTETGRAGRHRVQTLSGGERKRVSIGVELVGRPQLLLLDEPTSGLDLGKDRAIMQQLHRLSRDLGCTVIVVTHSVAHLEEVDRVIMLAPGGRVQYQGPPAAALCKKGFPSWADWLDTLDTMKQRTDGDRPVEAGRTYGRSRTGTGEVRLTGLRTALERQATLLARQGWKSLAQLLALPLVGTLIAVSASPDGLRAGPGVSQALAVLVTVAALTGASLTYQDLVHDRRILQRDWRVGISAAPLVLAKILVFGAVCAVLSALMAICYSAARDLPESAFGVGPRLALGGTLFLVTLGSAGAGLLISTWAKSMEQAVTLSTILAVLQVALNGSLFELPLLLAVPASLLPSRLGMAALAGYADLNRIRPPAYTDWLWGHGPGWFWPLIAAMLAVFTATSVLAVRRVERSWHG